MRIIKKNIILSAGDLSNHMSCKHRTTLDQAAALGILEQPAFRDPSLTALQERGFELEREYLDRFRAENLVISAPDPEEKGNTLRTITAMKDGVDIIYQASMEMDGWIGRADFLKKVSTPSDLGNWSYEVVDAKLARETRAGTILQLCLYSEMLAALQGNMPEKMHVVTPGADNNHFTYRVDDFFSYYRYIKRKLVTATVNYKKPTDTYPNPCSFCGICNWWDNCNQQRRKDDHLGFVAGLANNHLAELSRHKITTLKKLAKLRLPLPFKPDRGAIETYTRLREQARLQEESRTSGKLVYEFIDLTINRGFFQLPSPSSGDIFFDIEGDPFVGISGLEFLFGWVPADAPSKYEYQWALNPVQEKRMFQTFIGAVMKRWKQFPDMHIYHFTAYEPSALKRLMGKYATCEQEVDQMLRAGMFVDLHSITRQAIRVGVETYSLKELEKLHHFERKLDLAEARHYLRIVQRQLERQDEKPIEDDARYAIENYNKEDCLSTRQLRDWLESLREQLVADGQDIGRPIFTDGSPDEELTQQQQRIGQLIAELMVDIPEDPSLRKQGQQARWLLAGMLDWYRREEKSLWWEFFRQRELSPVEMMEEKNGIGRLKFTGKREDVKRVLDGMKLRKKSVNEKSIVIDEYTYPSQEADLRDGDEIYITGSGTQLGEIVSIDTIKRLVKIKKRQLTRDQHPDSIFVFSRVPNKVKAESIERMAQWVLNNGINAKGNYRAGRDLLLNLPPREIEGVLPIQGPPGAGKSHRAAEMILEQVKAGKRVGITALSHKVITALMHKVIHLAKTQGIKVICMRKVSELPEKPDPYIIEETSNQVAGGAIRDRVVHVLGGTAWLWSRADMAQTVDTLFVDEAGQLSLIDTLAVSQAATSLVLLGDPQQLQQPQRGNLPEGTEVSALQHILGEHKTIPADKGVFLGTTWRMHPSICALVSELFYDGKLGTREELAHQALTGKSIFTGAGSYFCGIPHEGNQSSSVEEVIYITKLIEHLTSGKVYYQDKDKKKTKLTSADIKIITPYNAQVNLLSGALPSVQVGTVDRFQGQEAPVIIFAMATSTPADAPRGMEFLYSGNRFNVAISRARAAFILVASPALFDPECRTVVQMKLANAFSRFLEVAKHITPGSFLK
jgi:predicted RecB family nuclease